MKLTLRDGSQVEVPPATVAKIDQLEALSAQLTEYLLDLLRSGKQALLANDHQRMAQATYRVAETLAAVHAMGVASCSNFMAHLLGLLLDDEEKDQ